MILFQIQVVIILRSNTILDSLGLLLNDTTDSYLVSFVMYSDLLKSETRSLISVNIEC